MIVVEPRKVQHVKTIALRFVEPIQLSAATIPQPCPTGQVSRIVATMRASVCYLSASVRITGRFVRDSCD